MDKSYCEDDMVITILNTSMHCILCPSKSSANEKETEKSLTVTLKISYRGGSFPRES